MKKYQNKNFFNYILADKYSTLFAALLSTLFVYKLGKSVGEFVYYLSN
jgi:hypothetical protein